jgi:hypothetical protein
VSASFVPLAPETMWLELSALRRPEYPFVYMNMPEKVSRARRGRVEC